MLIESYREFAINQKIAVKQDVLYEFITSSFVSGFSSRVTPVIDYAFNKKNQLTISEIEYEPNLLLPAAFLFVECEGNLFYGQFIKSFPTFHIIKSEYFKG